MEKTQEEINEYIKSWGGTLLPNHFVAAFLNNALYTDYGKLADSVLTMDAHGGCRLTHLLGYHTSPLQEGQIVQLPNFLECYSN